jgi:CMP-N,N'-diacetyllegionaminic acid synthase
MLGDLSVLALVTARGGSKGLPGKNLREVAGRSLIEWAARAALRSRYVDRAVLSTDDEAIRAAGVGAGLEAPFLRSAELASDTASSLDVVLDALDRLTPSPDLVVLLQPTSPLRRAADVDACIERCAQAAAPACVSVAPVAKSPYWMYSLDPSSTLVPVIPGPQPSRRQDAPPVFELNGAVYVVRAEVLRRERTFAPPGTVGYVMDRARSIDIDVEDDLRAAEAALRALAPED